eukprot:194561_1
MATDNSDPYELLYFKYIMVSMWFIEAIVIFIILLAELRTYYKLTSHIETIENVSVTANDGATKSDSNTGTSVSSSSTSPPQIVPPKLVFMLTILPYIFYIITGIVGVAGASGVASCDIFVHSAPIAYTMGKGFMYIFYIYRLHIVYSESTFAYNNRVLVVLFVVVVINAIFQIAYGLVTAGESPGTNVMIYHYANGERLCRVKVAKINLVTTATLDVLIASFCTYLFIRPLLILNRDNSTNNAAIRIVLKYSLLTFIMCSSTVLLLGCIEIMRITTLVTIDIVINCICIMFFSDRYEYQYKMICCAAISMWHRLFHRAAN